MSVESAVIERDVSSGFKEDIVIGLVEPSYNSDTSSVPGRCINLSALVPFIPERGKKRHSVTYKSTRYMSQCLAKLRPAEITLCY